MSTMVTSLPFASVTLQPPLDTAGAALPVAADQSGRDMVASPAAGRSHPGPTSPSIAATAPPTTRPARPAGAAPSASSTNRLLRRASVAALLLSLAVTGSVVIARPAGVARISILNVGQGDTIAWSRARGAAAFSSTVVRVPSRLMVVLDAGTPPWDRVSPRAVKSNAVERSTTR